MLPTPGPAGGREEEGGTFLRGAREEGSCIPWLLENGDSREDQMPLLLLQLLGGEGCKWALTHYEVFT